MKNLLPPDKVNVFINTFIKESNVFGSFKKAIKESFTIVGLTISDEEINKYVVLAGNIDYSFNSINRNFEKINRVIAYAILVDRELI